MVLHFGRIELAEVSGLAYATLGGLLQRNLAPTFIDDPGRLASTAFDALMLTTADFFCRDGGYDRRFIANVLYQNLDECYRLAARIDANEADIVALIAQTEDRNCLVMGGNFRDVIAQLPLRVRSPARMCFVSMTLAARQIRERAKHGKIDIGDRFAMTEAEVEEIAKLAIGRHGRKKNRTKSRLERKVRKNGEPRPRLRRRTKLSDEEAAPDWDTNEDA
ncbi:hypothetical protein AC629_39995 [Bradyrhizobium sp. NAS80.1]|nr:hypothetical protein AC629_39995 [Bradyrhizobium sp. NAS80.1]